MLPLHYAARMRIRKRCLLLQCQFDNLSSDKISSLVIHDIRRLTDA